MVHKKIVLKKFWDLFKIILTGSSLFLTKIELFVRKINWTYLQVREIHLQIKNQFQRINNLKRRAQINYYANKIILLLF